MSYPNDAPAAAWYPDPQTPGQVRWWDGTNWTEHVSTPAAPAAVEAAQTEQVAETAQVAQTVQAPQTLAAQLAAAPTVAVPTAAVLTAAVLTAAVPTAAVPTAAVAESSVETLATVSYIGRHAAGATPAPRQAATAPRFRARERVVEVPVEARVEAFQYA